MRPQIATYVLFALMTFLLTWCFQPWEGLSGIAWPQGKTFRLAHDLPPLGRRPLTLWLLPPVFIVWINAHGGFVAGILVLTVYLGCRVLQAFWADGHRAAPLACHLSAILFVSALCTFINPYGWELHRWLYASVSTPRPEIIEWHALDWEQPSAWNVGLLGVATLGSVIISGKRLDVAHAVVLLAAAYQSYQHRRHVVLLAILFAFWVMPHIDGFVRPSIKTAASAANSRLSSKTRRLVAAGLGILCIVLVVELVPSLTWIRVPRNHYPVDALQFMKDNSLDRGKIVVTFGWAQYVIGALGHPKSSEDGLLVAIDGRFRTCYPQEVLDIYLDFELGNRIPRHRSKDSPPVDDARALQVSNPDLVLLYRRQANAVAVMNQARDRWTLLYQDGVAQLWGRADRYDDVNSPCYVAPGRRKMTEATSQEAVPWPATPTSRHE